MVNSKVKILFLIICVLQLFYLFHFRSGFKYEVIKDPFGENSGISHVVSPAIIESSQSRIPLIIITADRPANLLNSGENQTIEQKNIYGNFVRKNIDIPLDNEYDYTLSEIDESLRFVAKKNDIGITPGPIHINIHLDDFIDLDPKINKSTIKKNLLKRLNCNVRTRCQTQGDTSGYKTKFRQKFKFNYDEYRYFKKENSLPIRASRNKRDGFIAW